MVGFVRFKGYLEKEQELKLSHGEVLQNDSFYHDNYRTAESLLNLLDLS